MDDSVLSPAERKLLSELSRTGVRFMVVGMSAALMQGARGATEGIDLWFADISDAQIGECVKAAGAFGYRATSAWAQRGSAAKSWVSDLMSSLT